MTRDSLFSRSAAASLFPPMTQKAAWAATREETAPVVFLDDSAPGCVFLFTESGYWTGPGLGDFRSATAARQWAESQGFRVAPLLPREEAAAILAAAMRASLAAVESARASLSRRAAASYGRKAAALAARLRIVRHVESLKAGAVPGELAAAFALQVKAAPAPELAAIRGAF